MAPPHVSICQADLGLAEPRLCEKCDSVSRLVSICQADLGLAELLGQDAIAVVINFVSICQADLGLAEPCRRARRLHCIASFNLPGRFGFGRTAIRIIPAPYSIYVSICQADLGLAEHSRRAGPSRMFRSFNLPGRFGFGRTPSMCSGLWAPISFQSARQIWVWPNWE